MQIKKLDSPVLSIPCQARDRLRQAYQVRNDRIFEVISGGHLREADWGKDGKLRSGRSSPAVAKKRTEAEYVE